MKTPKDKFTITITEKDRQMAEKFTDECNCLIATALKRRGYAEVQEGVDEVIIGQEWFTHPWMGVEEVCRDYWATKKPFYFPSVVGKKITFCKKKD